MFPSQRSQKETLHLHNAFLLPLKVPGKRTALQVPQRGRCGER